MQPQSSQLTSEQSLHLARKATWIGFYVNAVLSVAKIIAGVVGRSSAMIADGVHSLSDFITDFIVLAFIGLSRKKADKEHQYGHGKYETFATVLIAVILAIVAIGFLVDGVEKTWQAIHGHTLARPGWIALIMGLASVAAKEWLYRYTRNVGERIGSSIVVANAWHHRSDALSSFATILGIAGAMFLGPKWRVLDPLAAMLVAVFIIIVSYKIARPAIKELLEQSLPDETTLEIEHIIASTPGVVAFHHLRTRRNGNVAVADFHIKVNPEISVTLGHNIATEIENKLKEKLGNQTIANIHVEPYKGELIDEIKHCADN